MWTAALALMLSTGPVPDGCAAMKVAMTSEVRAAEAARVTQASGAHTRPEDVTQVLQHAGWRLVWATPHNMERGVFFFRAGDDGTFKLIDTWGGVLPPGERDQAIQWAGELAGNPPRALAACFADALIAEP